MTILSTFGGTSGVDTGDIPASLRFRGAQYLSRTPGSTTNRRTYTISMWVKRGAMGAYRYLISAFNAGTNDCAIRFNTNDTLEVEQYTSPSYNYQLITTQVVRDPSAFIHVLLAVDTTQATAADRLKLFINGVQVTAFSTASYPSLNYDTNFNLASYTNQIGAWNTNYYLDGYLSRICFVDGQALTPSSVGYLNTEINEWVSKSQSAVKAVVDAGGTNSFMLDFDDATSLTTLGYDKSSKGNNWTLNNFSLTAGPTYDRMLDVPGNSFATLNPIIPSAANITNGNLTSGTTAVRATMNALAYNSKWEVTAGGSAVTAGVISATGTTNTTSVTANKVFAFRLTTAGALDYRNVTDAGSWTSITTGLSGEQYPYGVTQAANWNFGQAPLHTSATYQSAEGGYFYDTTAGYKALCQRNLPDPVILNPEKHFDVVTYTGNAATKSITGLLFSPGLVEMKSRGRALDWAYYDSVRGVEKRLESNNTDAEVTGDTTGLTAFNSDGWTMGALDQINGTTATNSFVGSAWKAGGAAVTNNAGSISSQVSANVEAGFSIVTGTVQAAGTATMGHGLGEVPALIIGKRRGNTSSWVVFHWALGYSQYLVLNSTAALVGDTTVWQATPTTSVFSLGTAFAGLGDYVFYCFAEIPGYSKFFYYTGNGSADGPFVHCGFKPKFILLKNASAAGNGWIIHDAVRNTYNVMDLYLQPNTSSAEGAAAYIDAVSNGFKVRTANADANGSTNTIIGIAFADVTAKYSLAR